MSVYQNIVKPSGSAQNIAALTSALSSGDPSVGAMVQGIQSAIGMLPNGGLKDYLTNLFKDPAYNLKLLYGLITGRKYTTGQYKLGERYIKQIAGHFELPGWQQVPDDVVPDAQKFFTIFFGVRITTGEDLDALDSGIDAYYARGEKNDIPRNAVERAVFLKQHYYPIASYNQYQWDVTYFERIPLVAPIPGLDQNTLYTGQLPGGAYAVNGVIPVNADSVMRQVIGGTFNQTTGQVTTASLGSITPTMLQKYAPLIALLIVVGLIISIRMGWFKP